MTAPANTAPGSAGQNGAHTDGRLKQGRIATPLSVRGGPGYGIHNGIAVQDARGYVVAVAINDVPELDAPALARLIAAAPQLLEALRELQQHWHHMIGLSSPPEFHRLNDKLVSAIAAATGEAV